MTIMIGNMIFTRYGSTSRLTGSSRVIREYSVTDGADRSPKFVG